VPRKLRCVAQFLNEGFFTDEISHQSGHSIPG
jgi:hypothetical protein